MIVETAVAVVAVEAATTMISKIDDLVMMIGQDDQIMIDMDATIAKENEDDHLIKTRTAAKDHVMTMMTIMVVDVVAVVHLHGMEIDIITMTTMGHIIKTKTMMIFFY